MKYLLLLSLIVSCSKFEQIDVEQRVFKVKAVSTSGNLIIDLEDTVSGIVYRKLFVSKIKHCPSWQLLKVGSLWELPYKTFKHPQGIHTELELDHSFCDRLDKEYK